MADKDISDSSDFSITDQEREFAQIALAEYNKGNFSTCLQNLAKLETRLQDPKVSHNKAVAEFYKTDLKKIETFKKNLTNVFVQGKLKVDVLEDVEQCVFHYNQAVLLYHQKKYNEALRIVDRIYKFMEPMDETLAVRVCLLLVELNILLHQQNKALTYIECFETQFVTGDGTEQDEKSKENKQKIERKLLESFLKKLTLYRAKCYLMNHSLKSAKREIKNIASAEGQTTSVLCLRAQLEYLKGNFKNAIKIFNSSPTDTINIKEHGENSIVIFYNNMGVLHHSMGKTNLACHYFKQALKEDQNGLKLFAKSDNGEWNKPLYVLGFSRYHEIMYNLGITLLYAGQPTQSFDCLIIAVQRYHRNSRLWLRIAECCIQVHKSSNEIDFNLNKRQRDIIEQMVGSGNHRKVILTSRLSKDMKYSTESQTYAVPVATLEFASLCLRNALLLLPSENESAPAPVMLLAGGIQPPPPPPSPSPAPSSPLSPSEAINLKNSVLIASAYVSLCLGDYVLTLEHAQMLLTQTTISGAHKLLGHLYAAEALVLMNKINEAIEHLNPDYITDISLDLPKDETTNDDDESTINTKPQTKWFPENLGTAHAVLQYNLAVALTIQKELEKAADLLKKVWHSRSTCRIPIHVVMLFLYIELQLGHIDVARNFIKQYYSLQR